SEQVSAPAWNYGFAERRAELGDAAFRFCVAMIGAKTGPGEFAVLDVDPNPSGKSGSDLEKYERLSQQDHA
ncbi:hypothetical protein, partial [Brucella melitensis]|uniref:hypothetical protein n=1 Tax=Brucella melitensis TaxID=29459 RepID=UPI003F685E44